MTWVCRVFGHRWHPWAVRYDPAPNGWWFEWTQCERCCALRRELVASQQG
jgi:hypothetical protein